MNILKNNYQNFEVFNEKLSINQKMVPYNRIHEIKQFMKRKSVKRVYKLRMLLNTNYILKINWKNIQRKPLLTQQVVMNILTPDTIKCFFLTIILVVKICLRILLAKRSEKLKQ